MHLNVRLSDETETAAGSSLWSERWDFRFDSIWELKNDSDSERLSLIVLHF